MALTKTIDIADKVLSIIATMEWEQDNSKVIGRLTCGQLDRGMYLAVNKALGALGGKWNRKLGGHVFIIDPRPQIESLLDTGKIKVIKDGYFPTPHSIGLQMTRLAQLAPGLRVLEPSAGTGELAETIHETEPSVDLWVAEKDARRQQTLKDKGFALLAEGDYDFLTTDVGTWPRIIQNPPFEEGQDIDHVMRAYECLESGGILVSVTSESPFFRNEQKYAVFRQWVGMLKHKIVDLGHGAFQTSGTGVKARIVVIQRDKEML